MPLVEKSKRVALWIGTAKSPAKFKAYVAERWKGDSSRPSAFAKDFGIDWYDHDFFESATRPQLLPIEQLLKGFSYAESYGAAAAARLSIEKGNAVVLLLRCEYEGKGNPTKSGMTFIGNFDYDTGAEDRYIQDIFRRSRAKTAKESKTRKKSSKKKAAKKKVKPLAKKKR